MLLKKASWVGIDTNGAGPVSVPADAYEMNSEKLKVKAIIKFVPMKDCGFIPSAFLLAALFKNRDFMMGASYVLFFVL
jgi:hypothetical protein